MEVGHTDPVVVEDNDCIVCKKVEQVLKPKAAVLG
jgi:hypothetical protein